MSYFNKVVAAVEFSQVSINLIIPFVKMSLDSPLRKMKHH